MDSLERGVRPRQVLHHVEVSRGLGICHPQPIGHLRMDVRERGRDHPAGKRQDVVESEAARPLAGKEVDRRGDLPGGRDDTAVDLAHLGQKEIRLVALGFVAVGLGVDPVGSVRVSLDLEILLELLVTDGAPLGKEGPHLLEDEGVAFDRGRVVRLLEPDVAPDVGRGLGARQASDPAQLDDTVIDGLVDGQTRWAAATRLGSHNRVRLGRIIRPYPSLFLGFALVKKRNRTQGRVTRRPRPARPGRAAH